MSQVVDRVVAGVFGSSESVPPQQQQHHHDQESDFDAASAMDAKRPEAADGGSQRKQHQQHQQVEEQQKEKKKEHAEQQARAKAEAEVWSAKGLGLLPDGSVPRGEAALRHAARELAVGTTRGVALGVGLKGALSLLLALIKGKRSPREALSDAMGPDTRRFAGFLGGFTGLFRFTNALATSYTGRDSPMNSLFAGGVAGLTLLADDRERRKQVALYLFSRSMAVVVKRLVREGALPYWKHFEAFMFGVSNVPIMYGFLFEPEILQKGYYQWILHMGNVTDEGLHSTLRQRRETMAAGGSMAFQPCCVGYHEGPCTVHCVKDWFLGLFRASKIYVSVHLLALAFRRKALMQDPQATLLKTAAGFLSSCVFLSTYVFFVKSSQCFLRNTRQVDADWHAAVAGMLTGVSTLFEKPSRVSELMLYCVPRAMEATWIYFERRSLVQSIPGFEAVIFSAAMSILTAGARTDFKHSYHDSLCFLLGSAPRRAARDELARKVAAEQVDKDEEKKEKTDEPM